MPSSRNSSYRWVILAVAFFGIFGALGFGRFGYSAILPDMQRALELSSAAAGSLASWNLAGYTIMGLVGGILASRFGARLVVTTGMVLTTVGMLLTGVSGGLLAASAARFVTGLGNGMVMAPSIALMSSWFDSRRLGFASTVAASGNGLGLMVAGPVVPRIIAAGGLDGWRWAWFFFAALTAVVAIVTFAFERDRPYETPRDRQTASPDGHNPRLVSPDASWAGESPTGGSAERRGRQVWVADFVDVLRSGYAWHLGVVYCLYGVAFLIYFTFFQKRLIADLQLSAEAAGSLFLAVGASSLVFGLIWGAVSDRIGRGPTLGTILALQGVAACLFGFRLGTAALILSAIFFGSGVFGVPGLVGAACGDGFGARLAFMSLGFVTVFIGIGMVIGPYVGGLLADHYSSLGPSYLLAAGVFLLSAVAAFCLRDARGECSASV